MTRLKPISARVATVLVVCTVAGLFGWQMLAVRQTVLHEARQQMVALARTAEVQILGELRAATVTPASLANGLAALPLGTGGQAWLIGAEGGVLAQVPSVTGVGLLAPVMGAALSELSNGRVVRVREATSGRHLLVTMRSVVGTPYRVMIGQPVDAVLAFWWQSVEWYGLMALAMAILAVVYAGMFDRQISRVRAERREKERMQAAAAAHQRGVLDATIDGLITLDENGLIHGCNRSAERIFGYSEAELLGQPLALLMPGLAQGGGGAPAAWPDPCGGEVMGVRQDGRIVPLDMVVTELPSEALLPDLVSSGQRRLFIGTVRDMAEHRAAQAALRASQERNAAILAAVAEGVIAVDVSGRMEMANAAAGRIFGYDPAEMIGRNVIMLMPVAFRRAHDRQMAECARIGGLGPLAAKREVVGVRCDGAEFPLEIAISILEQPGGPLFIAALSDITQRKEAEKVLRAAKLDAEAANQAKTQFLAHMSHELRTPLNAIIGFSDMMRHELMGGLPSVYLDYAYNINESGRQLMAIIDDLLDVSRLQLGKFVLCDGDVDLHSTVEGALILMRPRAVEGGIALIGGVDPSLPKLRGDARAVRQILINLVSNAVKFTPRGGTVRVDAEYAADGRLLLLVTDTGRGIPPEFIDVVLDPFHQSDAFLACKTRGIGLGLPICRRLMELHAGSLTIKSIIASGTTVIAGFPKERVMM